jgi:hypothetical protein
MRGSKLPPALGGAKTFEGSEPVELPLPIRSGRAGERAKWVTALILILGFLVVLSLAAIALDAPSGAYLLARSGTSPDGSIGPCATPDFTLDEGYGVTSRTLDSCLH